MTERRTTQHSNRAAVFLGVLSSVLVSMILYAYQSTEIHKRLENLLYDFRLQLIPQISPAEYVSVVAISGETIVSLDGQEAKKLSVLSLIRVIKAVLDSGAKSVGVLMPHQDFDYDSEEMWPLVHLANDKPNIYFGIFDESRKGIMEQKASLLLEYANDSVFFADTNREFRRAVVRYEILQSKLGGLNRPHLTTEMALSLSRGVILKRLERLIDAKQKEFEGEINTTDMSVNQQVTPAHFKVNFKKSHAFITVKGEQVVNQVDGRLKDKVVLIGYTAFRKRKGAFLDGTFINSPWEGENNRISEHSGMPLVYVHAAALENQLTGTWLVEADPWVNVLQIIILSLMSFWGWRATKTVAVVGYLFVFFILIVIHCALISYANYLIPLGDTVLISLFASIAGALFYGQRENAVRALNDAKRRGEREIGQIQSKFLDRFSTGLYSMNSSVLDAMKKSEDSVPGSGTIGIAMERAIGSCIELQEYLHGIKQLSSLDRMEKAKVLRQEVVLTDLMERLRRQFESKLVERNIKLEIVWEEEQWEFRKVWSHAWFLESILFNLISNAIKYSPENQTVEVRVSKEDRKNIRISVADLGAGIDAGFQSRIFEKFYRIKDDSVFTIKGSGLGLYLSRYFAKKIGTDIFLESKVGKGSIFWVIVELYDSKYWRGA